MPLITPARFAMVAAALAALSLPVLAQTMDHTGHTMTGMETPATMAFMQANAAMHEGMGIAYTGNADVDFVAGMIPHHKGAVDMARIVLEHGTDPQVRAFAQGVIDAQEAEIVWMTEWLAKNAK